MAISPPRHVVAAKIQDRVIRYRWDDWDLRPAEFSVDEEYYKRLQSISQRADMAFALGTAEWIVHRFSTLLDTRLPQQYLEAAWAQMIHWRYRSLNWDGDTHAKDWSGPVRMPVWRALALTEFVIYEAEQDGAPARGAARIASLAEHVMADPGPYRSWRERTIERLESHYRLEEKEKLGEVVPREALDPDVVFNPEETELLANRFLASIDYKANPFLNPPEKMREQGFKGTPYRLNIRSDRKARYEW